MKKIQGRTTDFVVTPDGRWQHALSVIYVVRDIPGVIQLKNPAASCRESSTVRNSINFLIRSHSPQQAAGNALAVAVQNNPGSR
uniref:Uncharacterized protein n=1 Tax=Candidatus Methanogaster sp. ANME-2c ERB4 TaxID=2759911 RepID=A0A7G9YFV8_9EURY|nr:hypothetical protein EANENNMH_00005 [Methanosarcinales archaeon ANME-2c ERB4]QNO46892.1 hypothetical protein EAHOLGKO_00003 [Methanosarcinales archaeon ANME-2c ERB4]